MKPVRVEASHQIPAPIDRVWEIITDYETEHPANLAEGIFPGIDGALREGQGAGTRIHLVMTVLGQTNEMEMVASEPTPGKHLRERSVDGTVDTHFYLEPAGDQTKVTIATRFHRAAGRDRLDPTSYPARCHPPHLPRRARYPGDLRHRAVTGVEMAHPSCRGGTTYG